jgi:hypothetical protein
MLRSEFMPQVGKIVRGQGLVEEFVNEREEVMQGANGTEWRIGRIAQPAARSGQQEGGFNERERDVLLVELGSQAAVVTRVTLGRIG